MDELRRRFLPDRPRVPTCRMSKNKYLDTVYNVHGPARTTIRGVSAAARAEQFPIAFGLTIDFHVIFGSTTKTSSIS